MRREFLVPVLPMLFLSACGGDPETSGVRLPDVSEATFVEGVKNPYFPLPVGAKWVLEDSTGAKVEHIEIEVLSETRDIQGIKATVVRDTATIDGAITEDTLDFYAEDAQGNVWYLGEETCEYENGKCADTHGSWQWGKGGALPGLIMPATPKVDGQPYYQEYDKGEAEDVGEVIAVGQSATVKAGSWDDCVKTRDTSMLEKNVEEHKLYCRGVGNVLVESAEELIEYSGL